MCSRIFDEFSDYAPVSNGLITWVSRSIIHWNAGRTAFPPVMKDRRMYQTTVRIFIEWSCGFLQNSTVGRTYDLYRISSFVLVGARQTYGFDKGIGPFLTVLDDWEWGAPKKGEGKFMFYAVSVAITEWSVEQRVFVCQSSTWQTHGFENWLKRRLLQTTFF